MRRWLRVVLIFLGVIVVVLGAAIFLAARHLSTLAEWALERAMPGVTASVQSASVTLPSQLNFQNLVLKSRTSGETLLTLNGGSANFDFSGLRHRQIREIRLVEPVISLSPRFGEAFLPPSSRAPEAPGATVGRPWSVGQLVCDYGILRVLQFGANDLALQAKFACDFQNFSPTGAPEAEHELVLWDLSASKGASPNFLTLDLVRATFKFASLLEKQTISKISLEGGTLIVGQSLRELFAPAPTTSPGPSKASPPWMVQTLDIAQVNVRIDDERPEITDITFALNTTLQKIPLSQTASALGAEDQIVEITNLDILSPHDPLTKVLTLEHIYFHFTLAGIIKRQIADLTLKGPTIHVGPDLFWYMENIQKRLGISSAPTDASDPTGRGWTIERLFVAEGKVVIGSGGRRKYGIPLEFYTKAQDVALDNLAALKLEAALEIPPEHYVFDSYQVEFTSEKGGTLKFSYPPEKGEKNLVGDITLTKIRWRQYQASDAFVSVTFSKEGINGLFGGSLYRGKAGGGFSFFFDAASPWIGWLYGNAIDLRRLTDIVSPQNFRMTGPITFTLQMDAQGKTFERILGKIKIPQPGKLTITKLDAFLDDLPPRWTMLKRDSTRIALETLRDFEYDSGTGNFWFVRSQGIFRLQLQGPQGLRSFDVVLHSDDSPQGQWKKRSANP